MKESFHLDLAGFGKNTKQASDLPFPLPAPPTKKRKKPTLHKDYYFYNNVARFIA